MNSKKGFTLIELLVVIAIIGILSSIVLVALRGARNKARDARIISDMSQIRSLAEVVYDGDYDALRSSGDYTTLTADASAQGGTTSINTTGSAYCVYSTLNQATQWFCVDSTGRALQTGTAPSGVGLCTATTFLCP
jgi:prepilin-type N-terminal cleavage/methylation domain-containing protein